MSDYIEYSDLVQEVRGALNPGRLKLQSTSVIFKNIKTGKIDQYHDTDVASVFWLKRARGYCLKVLLKNDIIHRYDGFKDADYEKLSTFFSKYYKRTLEKVDMAVKGWNWGVADFQGNGLCFKVDNKLAFEIPLTNVSHTTTAKNEVTLEFHQNDDASVSLTELRFHIPSDNTENDPVQEFYKAVADKADIIQATGDALVTFPEVQCLTPRGRYDIKIYPTFLQLHGKTFDYKIPYTTILRLFLLPTRDHRLMYFVISLDPPIKQGQTRYHFLIVQFNKEDEMTIELDDDIEQKYDGKLSREMTGPEYEVVSRIFKAVVNRKITVPGAFISNSGNHCISCSYKASTGVLYPLERGFIFLYKPPIHVRFDEISAVNFARSAGSTRSFDFDIETKSGTGYTFVGIEKDEYGKLYDYVKGKKLRVKNIGGKFDPPAQDDMMDTSSDEGDHDAYMERMKAEGKDRDENDLDDDSDSSDESFNPGESGSDVKEEFDSNPETTSESDDSDESGSGSGDEAEKKEKREQKEKEKRERKEKKIKERKPKSEGKERKRKKTKGNRDPNMPKRPQTGYFIWLNEHREEIKSETPGISVVDISKKAGEMWRGTTDKSKWEKLSEIARQDYKVAMEEYNKNKPEVEDESPDRQSATSKKKKSPAKSPKKGGETRAGTGGSYKSKEFISSSESDEDDDDKPLKKPKKDSEGKRRGKKDAEGKRRGKKDSDSSEAGELPEEEEILSSPMASEESGGGSDRE